MFRIEDRQKILLALQAAYEEVNREITDDRAGYFNARTTLEVLRKKVETKLVEALNESSQDIDIDDVDIEKMAEETKIPKYLISAHLTKPTNPNQIKDALKDVFLESVYGFAANVVIMRELAKFYPKK